MGGWCILANFSRDDWGMIPFYSGSISLRKKHLSFHFKDRVSAPRRSRPKWLEHLSKWGHLANVYFMSSWFNRNWNLRSQQVTRDGGIVPGRSSIVLVGFSRYGNIERKNAAQQDITALRCFRNAKNLPCWIRGTLGVSLVTPSHCSFAFPVGKCPTSQRQFHFSFE